MPGCQAADRLPGAKHCRRRVGRDHLGSDFAAVRTNLHADACAGDGDLLTPVRADALDVVDVEQRGRAHEHASHAPFELGPSVARGAFVCCVDLGVGATVEAMFD